MKIKVFCFSSILCNVCNLTDEIFLPKEDQEHTEMDEFERELEEFKRLVQFSSFLVMGFLYLVVKNDQLARW